MARRWNETSELTIALYRKVLQGRLGRNRLTVVPRAVLEHRNLIFSRQGEVQRYI